MKTSDGISSDDWDQVKDYAAKIAHSSDDKKYCKLLNEMNALLFELQHKYGRLPSILATRADYTTDAEKRLKLLKEAYVTALESNDDKNIAFIAADMLEFAMEEKQSSEVTCFWLQRLGSALQNYNDDYLAEVYSSAKRQS